MKIILINPDSGLKSDLSLYIEGVMPLGLVYMATILKGTHNVKIFDLVKRDEKELYSLVKEFQPDVIGMSFNCATCFNRGMEIISRIRGFYKDAIMVGGGVHLSFLKKHYRYFFEKNFLDYIIEGEAELAFRDLIEALEENSDLSNVKGLVYTKDGKIVYNENAEKIDLNDLPVPDYNFLPVTEYDFLWCERPHIVIDLSRGCFFNCEYCSCKEFFGIFRSRKPSVMVNILLELKEKHTIKSIYFVDDDFFGDVENSKKLLELMIKKNIGLSSIIETRIDILIKHPELIQLMKEAGIKSMFIGIEDIDENILKYYNRAYDNKFFKKEYIKKTIKMLRNSGIFVMALMMYGSPLETIETIKQKTEFIKEINPNYVIYQIFTPHGRMMDKFFDEGKIKNRDFDYWNNEHFVCKTNFNEKQAKNLIDKSKNHIFLKNYEENQHTVIGRKHNAFIMKTMNGSDFKEILNKFNNKLHQ